MTAVTGRSPVPTSPGTGNGASQSGSRRPSSTTSELGDDLNRTYSGDSIVAIVGRNEAVTTPTSFVWPRPLPPSYFPRGCRVNLVPIQGAPLDRWLTLLLAQSGGRRVGGVVAR